MVIPQDKKICFLASSLERWDPRIFNRQAKSLVNFGFHVTYIVCDGKQDEYIDGINILSSRFVPRNRFQRFFLTKKVLYKLAISINADIYQISEPELIPLGLKLRRKGKDVLFDMREDYPHLILSKEYIPKLFRKYISLTIRIYFKYALKRFNSVISVTPHLVLRNKRLNNKSFLITNYPIIRNVNQIKCEDYMRRENIICYVGTVYRISRQEVVLSALEKINNVHYIIAGRMESYEYESELVSIPYWKKIKFINGVSSDEILSLYETVTIGNSLRDFSETGSAEGSLGVLKIFEYMEASLPIICSDVKLWKEIIEKYKCGICVNVNNDEEIKNAIQYLVVNKKEAYEMGQNGRRAVIEEFNWDTQEAKYIDVIRNL